MKVTYIYGLHNGDGAIRYVGKTTMSVQDRLRAHRAFAKRGNLPVYAWIRSEVRIVASVLEVVPAEGDWKTAERAWIAIYADQTTNLLNVKPGGEGGSIRTAEHRAAIAKGLRKGAFFPCIRCGEPTWRAPWQQRKNLGRYCRRACSDFAPRRRREGMPEAIAAAAEKRRAISHCPKGHPYEGDNLYRQMGGGRACRACARLATAQYRQRIRNTLI